jgi:hypothetical protein
MAYKRILKNEVIVRKAEDFGLIDSTKQYFIDGIIDMGATSVEIPDGGIYITGYNFNTSGLISTENNYTMFTSPVGGSGDVLFSDFHIDVSGISSKVYDLVSDNGFQAIEVDKVNYNNCTSLGEIDNYRQGLETGTGRFGGTPNLVLSGTWLGGYFIETSIVRSLIDGSYALYEEGVSFIMNSRFRSNQNIDLNTTVAFFDFTPSNFVNPNTVQLQNCIVTRNGVSNSGDLTIIPNMLSSDVESRWKGNSGLPNTFAGASSNITTEVATVVSAPLTFYDLAGTYTVDSLSHFDSPANGQLRHIGDDPKEYRVFVNGILDAGNGDEIDLKIVLWDDSASGFVDQKIVRRVVNNLQGGRDVAFFSFSSTVVLDQNDYIKLEVSNVSDTTNVTWELGSELIVEER